MLSWLIKEEYGQSWLINVKMFAVMVDKDKNIVTNDAPLSKKKNSI